MNLPLAMSPIAHHGRYGVEGGKYVCLNTDGSVLSLPKEQLRQQYPELETILPYLFE